MIDEIAIAEVRGSGLIYSADLTDLGLHPRMVRQAIDDGLLLRLRRGVYARAPIGRALWPRELHALTARATLSLSSDENVASHLTAAALHRLPLIGRWPATAHVLKVGAAGGSSSSGITRHRVDRAIETVTIDGVVTTTLDRTLIDVASSSPLLVAVTMMDAAIRSGAIDKDHLAREFEAICPPRRARTVWNAIEFSDGRSASPGESLCRVRAWELGFEVPQLQTTVVTRLGDFDVDFDWPEARLFGEFDGKVKYTRDAFMKGRSIDEVVLDEKAREDAIRSSTGNSFIRCIWREALDPAVFGRMLDEAGVPRGPGRSRGPGV